MCVGVYGVALDRFGECGVVPVNGARPFKRDFQQLLENTVAQDLL